MEPVTDRPRRPKLLPPAELDLLAARPLVSEDELLTRLEAALSDLPAPERAAAVVAFGLAEGPAGVAVEQDLEMCDADALARSALQLLRGAMTTEL